MRTLIFGTMYADSVHKEHAVEQWITTHYRLNPEADLMLVDSDSPYRVESFDVTVLDMGDNIGHLARTGRDGWGRAFCAGVQYAIDNGYDYAAHIESDSLFRLRIRPIFLHMHGDGVNFASVPVRGTKRHEKDWVETGLMLFNVNWMRDIKFVDKYNWQDGRSKGYPVTPEWHVQRIVKAGLRMMPWSAERGDRGQITMANVGDYDWVTHVEPEVFDAFMLDVLL